jgi:hypothetical protein
MCTLGVKKINDVFYLFKNRDREYLIDTKVVEESGRIKKLLIVDQKGHCEGINEYGIGLVSATLQPYPRIKYRTSSQIARRILDQDNIKDALKIIANNKISANIIIADSHNAYLAERTPYAFAATKIRQDGIMTNLSIKLNRQNGSKLTTVREWARARYRRGRKIIKNIKSFPGIIKFLSDKEGYPDRSICSGKSWWISTKCSYIFDLKNKKIFFCSTRPDKSKFIEYKL